MKLACSPSRPAAHALAHLVMILSSSIGYGEYEFPSDGEAVTQKKSAIRPAVSLEKSLRLLSRDSSMIPSFLERIHSSCRPSFQTMTKARIRKTVGVRKSGSHIVDGRAPPTRGRGHGTCGVQSKMKVRECRVYVKSRLRATCIAAAATPIGAYRVEKWPRNDAGGGGECLRVHRREGYSCVSTRSLSKMAVWLRETREGPSAFHPAVCVSVAEC